MIGPKLLRRRMVLAAALVMLTINGCSSDEAHDYAPPPPQAPAARPSAPSPPDYSGPTTLSRVKSEALRRRRVVRQLEGIFEQSQP